MKRWISIFAAALAAWVAVVPAKAKAQADEPWQFGASLYGWFPSVSSETTFPQGSGSDIHVDADDILSNIKFVFMGTLAAQKGRWGAFTDLMYIDIGDNRSGTRDLTVGGIELPAGASASADFDLKGWVWTLAGYYRAMATPGVTLDAFAGARLVDIKEELSWEVSGNIGSIPLPGRAGRVDVSASNWDGIVGVKGRFAFGPNHAWFAPYYLDVGTGDSDLTWQAMTGIGYAFRWGEVLVAWRYLDYDLSDSPIKDMSLSGPAIAVNLRW